MTGRIRTIKPEWLEDEELHRAGVDARVLSVSLILLADDYGRGRCLAEVMAYQVFGLEKDPLAKFREAFARLSEMGFARRYEVRGQTYFEVCNWKKHQRVDKPGKPHVPAPLHDSRESLAKSQETLAPDLRPPTSDLDLDRERGDARELREDGRPAEAALAAPIRSPEVQVQDAWEAVFFRGMPAGSLYRPAVCDVIRVLEARGAPLSQLPDLLRRWAKQRKSEAKPTIEYFARDCAALLDEPAAIPPTRSRYDNPTAHRQALADLAREEEERFAAEVLP